MGSRRPAGSLRGELTEFVGRRAELALVRQALGAARMVTLTDPGDRKTRLAMQAVEPGRRPVDVVARQLTRIPDTAPAELSHARVSALAGSDQHNARAAKLRFRSAQPIRGEQT